MSTTTAPVRLPLRRPVTGRRVGGVCAGIAAHLGLPVRRVRLAFVVSSLAAGAGVVMYVWLWATVPAGDPVEAARAENPVSRPRLAPRLRAARLPVTDVAVALLLLAGAGLLLAWRAGLDLAPWLVPALVLLGGAGLAWNQLDEVERGGPGVGGRTPKAVVRILAGVLLAVVGVVLLVGQGQPVTELARGALAGAAVLLGLALVLAPLGLRLLRQLADERAARAREAERADIAAHLHDSVLQTLALIRARAGDPDAVGRLARAQERELRAWLYTDRATRHDSLAEAVREVAAAVEDRTGVPVEVVTVGDARPGPGAEPLLAATREALTNAARHGRPPISLYLEVVADGADVFVRDRGDGFEPAEVPADRHGVRESIVGRMRRHGGRAVVRRAAGGGTEVALSAPVAMLGSSVGGNGGPG